MLSTHNSRYAFSMPERGQTALLFSPTHPGTVARIRRMNAGYIVVTLESVKDTFTDKQRDCEIGTVFESRDGSYWTADWADRMERVQVDRTHSAKAAICALVEFMSRQGAAAGRW